MSNHSRRPTSSRPSGGELPVTTRKELVVRLVEAGFSFTGRKRNHGHWNECTEYMANDGSTTLVLAVAMTGERRDWADMWSAFKEGQRVGGDGDEMLRRALFTNLPLTEDDGVQTTVTDRILKDRMLKANPAWVAEADKVDNLAFDNYKEEWKKSFQPSEETIRELLPAHPARVLHELESLHTRLDELQEQVDAIDTATVIALKLNAVRVSGMMSSIRKISESLTNETVISKIRRLFK
jgi:hypothetical protein